MAFYTALSTLEDGKVNWIQAEESWTDENGMRTVSISASLDDEGMVQVKMGHGKEEK